jgi:hypothetical protein
MLSVDWFPYTILYTGCDYCSQQAVSLRIELLAVAVQRSAGHADEQIGKESNT